MHCELLMTEFKFDCSSVESRIFLGLRLAQQLQETTSQKTEHNVVSEIQALQGFLERSQDHANRQALPFNVSQFLLMSGPALSFQICTVCVIQNQPSGNKPHCGRAVWICSTCRHGTKRERPSVQTIWQGTTSMQPMKQGGASQMHMHRCWSS